MSGSEAWNRNVSDAMGGRQRRGRYHIHHHHHLFAQINWTRRHTHDKHENKSRTRKAQKTGAYILPIVRQAVTNGGSGDWEGPAADGIDSFTDGIPADNYSEHNETIGRLTFGEFWTHRPIVVFVFISPLLLLLERFMFWSVFCAAFMRNKRIIIISQCGCLHWPSRAGV